MNKYIYNLANLARKIGVDFHEESNIQVQKMQKEIRGLKKVEFRIEQYPDGSWSAESVNIDGIITGGENTQEIPVLIKDAIFTYFEIPPYLCKDMLLRGDNEPVVVKQNVYV